MLETGSSCWWLAEDLQLMKVCTATNKLQDLPDGLLDACDVEIHAGTARNGLRDCHRHEKRRSRGPVQALPRV